MTNKKIAFALIVLAIVLVSGCVGGAKGEGASSGGLFGKKQVDQTKFPFVTGNDGLVFSFKEDAPPKSSFIADSFPITVIVENKGATDVGKDKLRLTLSNANVFGLAGANIRKNVDALEGAKIISGAKTSGAKGEIEFGDAKFMGLAPPKEEPKAINLDACYPYQTKLQARLCAASNKNVCDPAMPKTFFSSSGPVQILDYKQISARKASSSTYDLTFSFTVKNVGAGDVYRTQSCDSTSGINKNSVLVSAASFVGQIYNTKDKFSCSADIYTTGFAATKDGKTITCAIKGVSAAADFEDTISLTVNYVYSDLLNTNIIIMPEKLI